MGNSCQCIGYDNDKTINKRIEALNQKAYQDDNKKIKILLLGAGESGKSTLFKQMRLIYGKGEYSVKEKKKMINIVKQNIVYNFCQLIQQDTSEFDLSVETLNLWKSRAVQEKWTLEKRAGIQVQDSLEYFMQDDNFTRIMSPEYLPTHQDILRCRIRTSGIVEEEFEMESNKFLMVDVGGQRNERRKWIHAFEDVDCIIFVAAISEYDQVLFEDNGVKRQNESLELFKYVCNEKALNGHPLILFLNKSDLFRTKLLTIPFRSEEKGRNLNYTGPTIDKINKENIENFPESHEFEEIYAQSLCYMEHLYLSQAPHGKRIYVKSTCATDTEQVTHIMSACKDIFLKQNLQKVGFSK